MNTLKKVLFFGMMCAAGFYACKRAQKETWNLDNNLFIEKSKVLLIGSPKIINNENGKRCMEFNGVSDALLVDANPIAGAEEFSIEVVFKPYNSSLNNVEQRFLHIQNPNNENRRILIELRLNNKHQWYADFFMCAEDNSLSLIDSTKTHPVNEWATAKLVYKKGVIEGYVNGVKESFGKIRYLPIGKYAKTSIGARMNRRSWFNGAISKITFSHNVSQNME